MTQHDRAQKFLQIGLLMKLSWASTFFWRKHWRDMLYAGNVLDTVSLSAKITSKQQEKK